MFPFRMLRALFSKDSEESAEPYQLPTENYRINKYILRIVGLWPFDTSKKKLLLITLFNFVMLGVILCEVAQIIVIPKRSVSFLIDSFMYILPTLCAVSGYKALETKTKEIALLFVCIKEFWGKMETKDEIRILEDNARDGRSYAVTLSISVCFPFVALIIQNMLPFFLDILVPLNETRSHKLKIPIYVPFDEDRYYFLLYFIFCLSSVTFALMILSTYTTSLLTSGHVKASFDVIGFILTTAFETTEGIDIEAKLIRAIKLHKTTLQYVDEINASWVFTHTIQAGFAGVIAVLDLIRTLDLPIIAEESLNKATVTVVYVVVTLLYILVCCASGQRMLNGSAKFYDTVCMLPWYNCPVRTQKLLILLLMRSQKDSYMSIGKMYRVSYELFSSILRTALSVAMMIRSLR